MPRTPEDRHGRPWVVPTVVIAAAALLIGFVVGFNRVSGNPADPSAATPSAAAGPTEVQGPVQPDLTEVERRDESDLLAAGPVDAPVALVVFSDYQCPFCARWSEETLPLMMEQAEAGDLRIEWRDVNVFGDASDRAARASYAAAEQGAFWDYHDALFPDGEPLSQSELRDDALVSLAEELGLDRERFASDLTSEETTRQIAENRQLGLDLGAYSTPAFILGGQPIVGAQPTQVFVDALDSALAAAK